jgi:hypothetical protein
VMARIFANVTGFFSNEMNVIVLRGLICLLNFDLASKFAKKV